MVGREAEEIGEIFVGLGWSFRGRKEQQEKDEKEGW